jgi:CheY-like chemotaxis protein
MKVSLAADGSSAARAYSESERAGEPFRIVLADTRLPEIARLCPAWKRCTVVLLTPYGRATEVSAPGASSVTKPVREAELRGALLDALRDPSERVEPVAPSRTAAPPPAEQARSALRILLAEDNAVNQHLARRLLEKRGHTVTVAADGCEALDALDREPFDVVLMDVQMPVMDGFEATAALRARESGTGRHLPIIALTAHAMKGDQERCLQAGMDGYVTKPVKAETLFAAIEAALVPAGQTSGVSPHA